MDVFRVPTAGIGCLECKQKLAQNLAAYLEPIRARKAELDSDPGLVSEVLEKGAARAGRRAGETLETVRKSMGLR